MKKVVKWQAIAAFLLFVSVAVSGQGYSNPVLSGFYPDPSVCRVGDDFYLVNSTFQYFPGLPIHHSKDLIHWEQIGHCINRTSQMDLSKTSSGGGLFAPTIRYHDGIYYVINTNVSHGGNFYITATDPAGKWSDPIWVKQGGIDPELFFDEDGKCYFMSTIGQIKLSEIDVKTGKLLTEPKGIFNGLGDSSPEGPHLYKKDGYYYLMIAEGGTEYGHKVMIARSKNIYGPYQINPANPILTHKSQEGSHSPIQGTGHADLVQAKDGSWWIMFLGFRPQSYMHHLLGRETFLAPVRWDKNAWPVVNGNGMVSLNMDCPTLPQVKYAEAPTKDEFSETTLGYDWNYLCNPHFENYSLSARKGFLRLKASTISITDTDSPTFIGRRQQHINFKATTSLDAKGLNNNSEAGLAVYMMGKYQYDLSVVCKGGHKYLTLTYYLGEMKHIEKEIPLVGNQVYLRVEGSPDVYTFSYSKDNSKFEELAKMNTRFLSSETAGGFTGVYLGLFAQEKAKSNSYADFDWFEYTHP
jgi:xylan 1,4-beta-xylosidase